MSNPLIETWLINSRTSIYVLDAAARDALTTTGATKGRTAASMFTHIHNVRLMWLQASAPGLMVGLTKFDKDAAPDVETVKTALAASAAAIARLIEEALANGGKVTGFKPHVHAFVGYLIAHEFYHLGEIGVALQQSGNPLDKKTAFGMWEWGTR